MHKAFNSIYMECRYIQFSAGDDGVPRRNGVEPVKVRKKELAVSTLATYFNVYINNG